jgi:hypothetical protein
MRLGLSAPWAQVLGISTGFRRFGGFATVLLIITTRILGVPGRFGRRGVFPHATIENRSKKSRFEDLR